jgi:hypothetical protein
MVIDRQKMSSGRPTIEHIDQKNYLDTEITPDVRKSEEFQTRNSLI